MTTTTSISKELIKAFREAGIGSNMWLRLASLSHVNPAYVRAHTAARQAGAERYQTEGKRNVAFQIFRMLHGDPAPDFCAECGGTNGHRSGCRHRYISGKYADCILHEAAPYQTKED